ncbi:hypothetical protein ATANTOWER_007430 [Ataeniobius toweri]|uniref:Uncharacterized protein n=1 Tax=Ataeniobius toweri TaxID=208326 RepID=A0ABU7A5V3_9TELE|nr:hypothetical protein [Ataeniobius toweri]
MLDHLHVACCWTPPGLPAPSAILYPRIVHYYTSQRAPRLIGRGRRSSDVTVDYVRAPETPTMAFHAGNQDVITTQLEHHSGEEIPGGRSFILPRWPTTKINERSFWDKKIRNFTLPIEGVDLTRNHKNHGVFKETQFFLLVFLVQVH